MEQLEVLLGGAGVLLCPSPAVPLSCGVKDGLDAGREQGWRWFPSLHPGQTFHISLPVLYLRAEPITRTGVRVGNVGGDLGQGDRTRKGEGQ